MDSTWELLDLSKVIGYPNQPPPLELCEKIHAFIKQPHKVFQHVWDFMDFMEKLNIIHEDIMMKLFVCTLRGILV
jgi:hypothetical protein